MENTEKYYLINVMGQDRPGLIAMLTKVVANANFNIIDIEEGAPHGLFYIIMIVEPTENAVNTPLEYFNKRFEEVAAGTELNISIKPFSGGIRKSSKSWQKFIFVGPDNPGLISAFSIYAGKNNVNIHRLSMISRGQIIACESLLDISDLNISMEEFNDGLKNLGEKLGLQIIIESENVFKKKVKKLLILDLDENFIQIQGLTKFFNNIIITDSDKELIQKLKKADNNKEIKEIGINYLKGMEINLLNQIINCIVISPGTEEFIRALKLMQYTIVLISNSLSLFTDFLKRRLDLEYAFGNAIDINDKIVEGNFTKSLEINPQKKIKLINWLATMEKIPEAEVIQFGLDEKEKDPIFSHSAGLKICIGFDYILLKKLIIQRKCSAGQILSVFISIGIQFSQIDKILKL
ncbi:MAG: ACT domain-containing protein [Promethearchaeota archaeon]